MSNRVKIKICGITRPEDAEEAVRLGADMLGFIFAESPRRLTFAEAADLSRLIGQRAHKVGVFVNEKVSVVHKAIETCQLDAVQLHGDEQPRGLASYSSTRVIKAFRMKDESVLSSMDGYREAAWAYLLDAYSGHARGGTGSTFNWELARRAKEFGKPIILSGGLSCDNIEEAVTAVSPYAVDVSSGLESAAGIKDHRLMSIFISRLKKCS